MANEVVRFFEKEKKGFTFNVQQWTDGKHTGNVCVPVDMDITPEYIKEELNKLEVGERLPVTIKD